jgi:hypothetical protein
MSATSAIITAATSMLGALADLARQNGDAAAESDLRAAMAVLQGQRDAIDDIYADARERLEKLKP